MVNKIGVFLLLLLFVVHLNRFCAENLQTGTGAANQLSRIAYGSEASILEHPYMVNIWLKTYANQYIRYFDEWIKRDFPYQNKPIIKEKNERSRRFQCGGTLISRTCILTAAHCMFDYNGRLLPKQIFEFYGGNSTCGKGILLPEVKSVWYDGSDSSLRYDMDVAIIKLTEPVKDPNIKTVEIDYSKVNAGETITIAGWGQTELGPWYGHSKTLKKNNFTVTTTEECQKHWRITEYVFCGKGLGSTNICGGDSGGPILRNGKQIGVVSAGGGALNCGYAQTPGVYTELSNVRVSEYLRQTIANNC